MLDHAQKQALQEVVYRAVIHARFLARGAQNRLRLRLRRRWSERVADLMDAVHNIPSHLHDPGSADLDFLLRCLDQYDSKWLGDADWLRLKEIYDAALSLPSSGPGAGRSQSDR